jgi:acyl carrier protein
MSKALHFGKVVLKPSWGELACPVQFQPEKASIKPDKSYLITGGVRGLGLLIAQWLVQKGAKHLILVNRSGEPYPETASTIQRLQEKACVEINKTDVSDRNQVAALIRKIKENHPPLDGVFHCAVVLKDRAIRDMTHDDVYEVLAPKAFGGLHLHEETKHLDLSIFFLMGSMASVVGNIGQANYSAANTVLKSIAALRIKSGLAAQYADWGLFHQAGVVFRDKSLLRKVKKVGLGGLSNDDFIEYLERILGSKAIVWGVPGSGFEKYLKEGVNIAPRMSILKNRIKSKKTTGADAFSVDFLSTPKENRLGKMMLLVKHAISDLLDLSVEDIEDEDKLMDLGIDSLNGIELITRLENDLGISVSPASLVQAPSIRLISERLLTILNLDYDILKDKPGTQLNHPAPKSGRETDPDLATALDQIKLLPDIPGTIRQKHIDGDPENRTIFLTGVTGLLGSHLFKDLITNPFMSICSFVRTSMKPMVRPGFRRLLKNSIWISTWKRYHPGSPYLKAISPGLIWGLTEMIITGFKPPPMRSYMLLPGSII